MQSEKDDDDARDLRQHGLVAREHLADLGGNRSQGYEDDAEAQDEGSGIQHDLAEQRRFLILQLFHSDARDQRHIPGHQRQHARREERNQAGQEGGNRQRQICHAGLLYLLQMYRRRMPRK